MSEDTHGHMTVLAAHAPAAPLWVTVALLVVVLGGGLAGAAWLVSHPWTWHRLRRWRTRAVEGRRRR